SLMTFVAWRGRALMNGVVKKEIIAALRQTSLEGSQEGTEDDSRREEPASPENVEDEVIARLRLDEIESILRAMPSEQAKAILEVWIRPRPLPGETRIQAAARLMGRSPVAMDSLLRRGLKRFRELWRGKHVGD